MTRNRILLLRAATGPRPALVLLQNLHESGVEAGRYRFGAPKIAMRPSIIKLSFFEEICGN